MQSTIGRAAPPPARDVVRRGAAPGTRTPPTPTPAGRRSRSGCSSSRRRPRATACSSWRAAPPGSGWRPRAGSRPGARSCSPTWPPEMTAIAAARARAAGLANVSARVLDLEDVDEPDASFDVVLCREGLMFAVDPARAARELRRVLRPGGRAAIAVWGPRGRNPWLGLVFDAVVGPARRGPCRRPGCPGRSRSGTPGASSRCCATPGWRRSRPVSTTYRCAPPPSTTGGRGRARSRGRWRRSSPRCPSRPSAGSASAWRRPGALPDARRASAAGAQPRRRGSAALGRGGQQRLELLARVLEADALRAPRPPARGSPRPGRAGGRGSRSPFSADSA